jgi:adenylosuccinate lyase
MDLDFPFSKRYGSDEMRAVWSDDNKRRLWRRIWVALAEAQARAGLVRADQVTDLRTQADTLNTARALEIETEIGHDVMAEVRAFAEQCPVGGGIIHWGATSADVTDNADVLRARQALGLIGRRLAEVLAQFERLIRHYQHTACMAYTHLQPAEPTTVGYRLAMYAQDLLDHAQALRALETGLRGKGFKGAVGTQASYHEMLTDTATSPRELETHTLQALGLDAYLIGTQTYPRVQDYQLLAALAALAASLHKWAFDLRILQSAGFGEMAEPFGAKQVGSSAMPFKRNPITAEKICSLARHVAALSQEAWANAADSLLERTLDDSANRRIFLPEAFLAVDEMLRASVKILSGLKVNTEACAANLARFGPFAATERVMMALVKAGADRQHTHERLREHSLKAWAAIHSGQPNPLPGALSTDPQMLRYLQPSRLKDLMRAEAYTGTAGERAGQLADSVRDWLQH